MSLNCLTCGQINFDTEHSPEINKGCNRKLPIEVERNWSGNISPPPPSGGGGAVAKIKIEHRRTNSDGNNVGPRLLRSSGMRRDWCLEELIGQQEINGVRCY